MNPRLLAIRILLQIIEEGKSLNAVASQINEKLDEAKDRSFTRELVFGVLRWQPRLEFIMSQLLAKPLKVKDRDVACVLLVGFYQVLFMRVPDHAAVSESVKLTQKLKKGWAKNLVNGVLRQLIREQEDLSSKVNSDSSALFAHPDWLIIKIKKDWPQHWQQILDSNNRQAPMALRVNRQKQSVSDYQQRLKDCDISASSISLAPDALLLDKPCDVSLLPGFESGAVSVQDLAAQQAASLLQLEDGCTVLDACAAPGGKTAHIVESNSSAQVTALDVSADRTKMIEQTLNRLGLQANIICADAAEPEQWWDGQLFDRILLDAPCSATGVIRRNPDIKIHRTLEDVQQVVHNQCKLLETLWPMLKPGGILLYATCSILKDENESQILSFLAANDDAVEFEFESDWGNNERVGKQVLPGDNDMDGFYYARIQKINIATE